MRSVYEGIGYNLRWILENYQKDYGFSCDNFRIIGGGALDAGWMQIIAEMCIRDRRSVLLRYAACAKHLLQRKRPKSQSILLKMVKEIWF